MKGLSGEGRMSEPTKVLLTDDDPQLLPLTIDLLYAAAYYLSFIPPISLAR
jgi:hypothetical protein